MKFLYEYRTSDNERHCGIVCAPSRDAAYAELKKKGIKPSRVDEAPGFFNKFFGKGKRWAAIALLAVLSLVLAVLYLATRSSLFPASSSLESTLDSTVRRQLIGDTAVIEKGIRTGWVDVFPFEGERFLAGFALPGQPPAMMRIVESNLVAAINRKVDPSAGDTIEARQLKAIVQGMKDEIRAYQAEGGSLAKYCVRLIRRQQQEISYYQRAEREIEKAKEDMMPAKELESLWERRNAELRVLGIRLVQMPE